MEFKCRTVILLVVLTFATIECKLKSKSEEDLFIPTHQWQEVKKGQVLPKGLHIRVNLETGKTEAKFLDNQEDETKAVQTLNTNKDDENNEDGYLKLSEARLKAALKNIKSDETAPRQVDVDHLKQFRHYEELKKELDEIKLNPKTDSEVLKNLIDKFKKLINAKKPDKLHILSVMEDLDLLVHQFDNAIEFVRLHGVEEVIYKNLNSSILEIKLESLKLLGSLVQNNAKVQIHVLETGALDFLLRMLVLNSNYAVKSRAVFALSSLLRRFPLAQLKFVENAGLNVFLELVSTTKNIKVRLKIVTLLNDLVLEHLEALENHSHPEEIAQYSRIQLKQKLSELDWCKYLTDLLRNIFEIDENDHDGLEKSLTALLTVVDNCSYSHLNSILFILEELQLRYGTLATAVIYSDDELDRDYAEHLETLCSTLIKYATIIKKIKTEL